MFGRKFWILLSLLASVAISAQIRSVTEIQNQKLIQSAKAGNLSVLSQIHEDGADLNIQEKETLRTPLHIAAERGSVEMVRYLLEEGADPKKLDLYDRNALFYSVQGARNIDQRLRKLEITRLLLAFGSDANQREERTQLTPLMQTSMVASSNPDFLRVLLSYGAEPNLKNAEGKTAADLSAFARDSTRYQAIRQEFSDKLEMLRKYGGHTSEELEEEKAVLAAIAQGNWDLARSKIEAGRFGVNYRFTFYEPGESIPDHYTGLHLAAYYGDLDFAKFLLEKGADPSILSRKKETPLQLAMRMHQDELVSWFSTSPPVGMFQNR